jgi:hypothetical protein
MGNLSAHNASSQDRAGSIPAARTNFNIQRLAQSGRASALDAEGRWFESSISDHITITHELQVQVSG